MGCRIPSACTELPQHQTMSQSHVQSRSADTTASCSRPSTPSQTTCRMSASLREDPQPRRRSPQQYNEPVCPSARSCPGNAFRAAPRKRNASASCQGRIRSSPMARAGGFPQTSWEHPEPCERVELSLPRVNTRRFWPQL